MRHYVCNVVMDFIMFPLNMLTTNGLSILLHGVISLSDATSYDKICLLLLLVLCFVHILLCSTLFSYHLDGEELVALLESCCC